MPRIQAPELADRIRRRFGMRGSEGPGTLGPEIVPVAVVDQLDGYGTPVGTVEEATAWATSGIASPTNLAHVGLVNPSGSGKILLVDAAIVSAFANATITTRYITSSLTTAVTEYWMDYRVSGSPVGQVSSQDHAGLGSGVFISFRLAANGQIWLPFDGRLVLTPATGILFRGPSTVGIEVSWLWRERAEEY